MNNTHLIDKVETIIASYGENPHHPLGNSNVVANILAILPQGTLASDVQEALSNSKYAARFAVAAAVPNLNDEENLRYFGNKPPIEAICPGEEPYHEDGRYDALEAKDLDVQVCFTHEDNTCEAPRTPYNIAQAIVCLLVELDALIEVNTGLHYINLSPQQLGQFMMQNLPIDNKMDNDDRVYWMQVGSHMGPDWIDSIRKVGAFMSKVESF